MVQLASVGGSTKKNAIGNFYVGKIDGEVMRKYLTDAGIPVDKVDPDGSDEQLAVRLSLYFQELLAEGKSSELFECEVCNGVTPAEVDSCPLCGNGGAIVSGDEPKDDPTEINAVQMNVEEPKPLPPAPKKASSKKGAIATKPEDAPRRDVSPPPADPKAKKEDPTMTAATSTTNGAAKGSKGSKKNGAATNGATALASVEHAVEVVMGAPDLDKAVARITKLKGDAWVSFWTLGRELLDISEKKLWKLRLDDNGKTRYTGWDAFATHELKMSPGHSYDLMKIAQNFTETQALALGKTKLALIAKAPADMQPELLEDAAAGASKRQIADKVNKAREKTGHGSTKQQGAAGKASAKKRAEKKAKTAKLDDKITISSIEGRKTIKFYAKPDSLKGVVMKDLKRAKTIESQPFARLELANEVVMHIFLKKTDNGIEAVIDTRREAAAEE